MGKLQNASFFSEGCQSQPESFLFPTPSYTSFCLTSFVLYESCYTLFPKYFSNGLICLPASDLLCLRQFSLFGYFFHLCSGVQGYASSEPTEVNIDCNNTDNPALCEQAGVMIYFVMCKMLYLVLSYFVLTVMYLTFSVSLFSLFSCRCVSTLLAVCRTW